jgi:glycine cleavage system H protein
MYPADRQYTKDHEWIRISGDTAEIGITDFAQQQLGDVVYVDLPDPGRAVTAGDSFGTIESVEVNGHLKDHPEVVNKDPHGTWMIKVRLSSANERSGLLDSGAYESLTK